MNDLLREFMSWPRLFRELGGYRHRSVPKTVSFGDDPRQHFLHFTPENKVHDEIIMYIHGGGWNSNSPEQFSFVGEYFAKAGYECILLGYRIVPKARYSDIIDDIFKGYREAVDHLHREKISCSRIIVTGSSAGAHLGSLLCYSVGLHELYNVSARRFAGFAGLAGPYCFRGKTTWVLRALIRGLFRGDSDMSDGEPYSVIDEIAEEDDPDLPERHIPMLLLQSEHDGLVGMEQAKHFASKAKRYGINAKIYRVREERNTHSDYSTAIFLRGRKQSPTLNALMRFIESIH